MSPAALARPALAALLLALAAPAPPAHADAARDEADIRRALERWTADFNAGRADRICDLFAPDLRARYQGQPEKRFDTLCPALQEDLRTGRLAYRYDLELQEIMVSGDMAAVLLIWHLAVTDPATGKVERSSDQGLDVFRRQPDGQWRIARFIAFPRPAPPPVARD